MKSAFAIILVITVSLGIATSFDAAAQEYFEPTADAYVRGGVNADTNYGEEEELRVRGSNSEDNRRKVYIKFDLSSYSSSEIGYATLSLTVNRAVGGSDIDRADFYSISDDNWSESEITWNNAPAPESLMFSSIFQRQTSDDADITYEFDVSEYVAQELKDDKIVTIYMYDDSLANTDTRFFSRESVDPPILTVYYPTRVESNELATPATLFIVQNYPNPFNAYTQITYNTPSSGMVSIDIYNVLGAKVQTLVNEFEQSGTKTAKWDARDDNGFDVPTGVYLARIQFDSSIRTIKLLLNR